MTLKDARNTLSNAHLGVNQVAGSVEEKSVVIEQSIKLVMRLMKAPH